MSKLFGLGVLLLMIGGSLWAWWKYHIPDFELPIVHACPVPGDPDDALKISTSTTPETPPPFAALPLQQSWDYSELVCTGSADTPTRTGRIEILDGVERDELVANVAVETCFKGVKPTHEIRVLGDSPFARKNITNGYLWAGPPPGFIARGRNLLFLRKAAQPDTWRVTVPVYENSIQLVDIPPAYVATRSDETIRRALVFEMEAMIQRGGSALGSGVV